MNQKIGVYLSSKSGLPASYEQAARELGEWIGRTGRVLVYGGARKGLMEVLQDVSPITDYSGNLFIDFVDILSIPSRNIRWRNVRSAM